jgi:uncharacterized membrane-anchored protein
MTAKSSLKKNIDQLTQLLSEIQDHKHIAINGKPFMESLQMIESYVDALAQSLETLPKGEAPQEDQKSLEKLDRVIADAKNYKTAVDKGVVQLENSGKKPLSEVEKKRFIQKRKNKFDQLGRL